MSQHAIFEIIGYIGSACVLASFLMASVVKLRIINSIGCIVSVIYGLLIHAYPTLVMNGALLLINIYFLWKMSKSKTAVYHVVKADSDDGFIGYFLDKYKEDIKSYFPAFENAEQGDFIRVSYCGDKAAGVLIGKAEGEKLDVTLDYTTPEFRDLSVGRWLYSHLAEEGIHRAEVRVPTKNHEKYMFKMGFAVDRDVYTIKM